MGAAHQSAAVTPERIMQMAWGFAPTMMMEAAVNLRVFDILDDGPKSAEMVANLVGASVRGVRALMNGLAGVGLLTKSAAGQYGLPSDAAAFLVAGKPPYLGALARHLAQDLVPMWRDLSYVVRTGKPAEAVNRRQGGAEFFENFVEDLFPMSYPAASALAAALNVANAKGPVKALDLAAGSGVWGIALAQKSAHVSVTAVDWPNVLSVTRKIAQREGVADRFSYIAGDLAEADFGDGYHIATLGHILHSEGEERSRALLKKTGAALAPGGTVAIAEFLVNEDRNGPPMGLIFAINMLVATDHGDTYSFDEIAGWLREAGFENPRTVDAPGPSPLILANRPY
jgi:hypothetical protein